MQLMELRLQLMQYNHLLPHLNQFVSHQNHHQPQQDIQLWEAQ
jgi:hypothetical protein